MYVYDELLFVKIVMDIFYGWVIDHERHFHVLYCLPRVVNITVRPLPRRWPVPSVTCSLWSEPLPRPQWSTVYRSEGLATKWLLHEVLEEREEGWRICEIRLGGAARVGYRPLSQFEIEVERRTSRHQIKWPAFFPFSSLLSLDPIPPPPSSARFPRCLLSGHT